MEAIKKFLENIFSTAQVRANDPFLVPFVLSWCLWNWHQLALLFFGDEKVSSRISIFKDFLSAGVFWSFNSFFWLPLLTALAYVFALPWIKYHLIELQQRVEKELKKQAHQIEIDRFKEIRDLNKEKLLSDPSKQFMEKIAQNEIDKEFEENRYRMASADKAEADASLARSHEKIAEANAATAEANALEARTKADAALKVKELQDLEIEQQKKWKTKVFRNESEKLSSTLASNRFPSAYMFISALEEELVSDNSYVPLQAIASTIALVFGYKDFNELLNDSSFNNDEFSEVKYIYCDTSILNKGLQKIVDEFKLRSFDVNSSNLYDSIISMFDGLPYKYVDEEELKDICADFFEENKNEILQKEDISSVMADSNTIYEEIDFGSVESLDFSDEMVIPP